jgi:RNA polymerase sigma-70 factor (ECF subfamily)
MLAQTPGGATYPMNTEAAWNESAGAVVPSESGRAKGIERPQRQDFEGIYQLYSRQVFSLCLRMTGNVADAEDLTQQAFLQVYRKLDTFRGESSFYTWLHQVAINVVLMRLRKRRSLKEESLEELLDRDKGLTARRRREVGLSDATPGLAIERVDMERALDRLPPGFRTILILHDLEGYQHVEISARLGCSISTSKTQLHRARVRIRKLMCRAKWQESAQQ